MASYFIIQFIRQHVGNAKRTSLERLEVRVGKSGFRAKGAALIRILVILPSLFEGPTLKTLVPEVSGAVQDAFSDTKTSFLVLDDSQGADLELVELAESRDDLEVWQPASRLGHQRANIAAIRALGSRVADYQAVVTMDADGEDSPEDVPRLLAPILNADADVVLAQRGKRSVGNSFRFGYLMYKALFRLLTGLSITSGNFAATRGSWWPLVASAGIWDLHFAGALASSQGRVERVLCDRRKRRDGKSRMGGAAGLVAYGLGFALPYSMRIAVRAAYLTAFAGLVAVALTLTVVLLRLFTQTSTPGWTTTVIVGAALVFLGSLSVLTISLVLSAVTQMNRRDDRVFAQQNL